MDWDKAINTNQATLLRIVAALFTMLGFDGSGVLARPVEAIRLAVLRILRPAESAVRRLIVVAARGLVMEPSPLRPFPKGVARGSKNSGTIAFQLFDTPKRFFRERKKRRGPRVVPRLWFGGHDPIAPPFYPRPTAAPEPKPLPEDDGGAARLGRRLLAIKSALEDLPRQALRLKRLLARRARDPRPRYLTPLRPGLPPGSRKDAEDDIDLVLRQCHWLAREALEANTS